MSAEASDSVAERQVAAAKAERDTLRIDLATAERFASHNADIVERVEALIGHAALTGPYIHVDALAAALGASPTNEEPAPCIGNDASCPCQDGNEYDDPDVARFLSHVDRSAGSDACHLWTASFNANGYGSFKVKGKTKTASRWWLEQCLGRELEPQEHALHSCDNPPCVNEKHLYVGTHQRNMQDAVERGRARLWNNREKRAQTHCAHGHEYTTRNTYVSPNGTRDCRECRRLRSKALRDSRRLVYDLCHYVDDPETGTKAWPVVNEEPPNEH